MRVLNIICPQCKSNIQLNIDAQQVYCSNCGYKVIQIENKVDESVDEKPYSTGVLLDASYESEKQSYSENTSGEYHEPDSFIRGTNTVNFVDLRKEKKRKVLKILAWIFFFPVMLAIRIIKNRGEGKREKSFPLIAIILVLFLLARIYDDDHYDIGTANNPINHDSKNIERSFSSSSSAAEKSISTVNDGNDNIVNATPEKQNEDLINYNEKQVKEGFNEKTNMLEYVGYYSFSIPDYWRSRTTGNYAYSASAEDSIYKAKLEITCTKGDDDPVTYDNLKKKSENGNMESTIRAKFSSCGEIKIDPFENKEIMGFIYTCRIVDVNKAGNYKLVVFPSEKDQRWVFISVTEYDDAQYTYFNDFEKIVNSATFNANLENSILVPYSSYHYTGINYTKVIEELNLLGFSDISVSPSYDIIWGITPKESLKQITIGGSSFFSEGEPFAKESHIDLIYHMPYEEDPEYIEEMKKKELEREAEQKRIDEEKKKSELNKPEDNISKSDTNLNSSSNSVYYSTNDKSTVKKGDSGMYSYRQDLKGEYDNYCIIDFDKGCAYLFSEGNGSGIYDKVKIESGTLNDVVIITYHDGSDVWSYGLHFAWVNQPNHLILQNDIGEYDYYPTDLNKALELMNSKSCVEY